MLGPIVVGTDGSATASVAVARAVALAGAFRQVLHIVSAYDPRPVSAAGLPAELEGSVTSLSHVEGVLAEACSRARAAGVEVRSHAVPGDPAEAILDVAEEQGADLIVIGDRGIGSKRRFLLGNVPSKVVHHAGRSVHVVHTVGSPAGGAPG